MSVYLGTGQSLRIITQLQTVGVLINEVPLYPAQWLERLPCEREVMALIPAHDRPKFLKLEVVASPFGAQDYENGTTTFNWSMAYLLPNAK